MYRKAAVHAFRRSHQIVLFASSFASLRFCVQSTSAAVPAPSFLGYPLLTILHFVIGSVPISSVSPPAGCAISTPSTVARAANIMSCIFGSATATLVALTVEEWTRGSNGVHNPGAAAAGALLFSLSPLTWEYSTAAEVFALNNFLVALALYLTARIIRRPSMVTTRVGAVVRSLTVQDRPISGTSAVQTSVSSTPS